MKKTPQDYEKNRPIVKSAADRARKEALLAKDPQFKALAEARTGDPAIVFTPEKQPVFWIIPFYEGPAICGYARAELSNRISQMSILGAGPEDRNSWIKGSFFTQPPADALAAVRSRFSGRTLSEPFLSYDRTPAQWAWRVVVEGPGRTVAFITPGGWYERAEGGEA
jgi:hypothetical protein